MAKQENPGHYTEAGTQKHQAAGPVAWGKVFRRVAGKDGRQGEGVRAALAYAVHHEEAFLRWAEAHPGLWAPASSAPKAKAAAVAKAAPKAKAPKAKGAVKAKAPKAAPKAKAAPEQVELQQ